MTMPPPWNAADPRASLFALADFFRGVARETIERDGTHVEILFLLSEDGTMQPEAIAAHESRESVTKILREQIPGSPVYGLIHIGEAWGYRPKSPNDHTQKQLQWGEMQIADLKDSDKFEVLAFSVLTRDGDSKAWYAEMNRQSDDGVKLGQTEEVPNAQFPLDNLFA